MHPALQGRRDQSEWKSLIPLVVSKCVVQKLAMLPSELELEKGAGVESSALIIFAREGGHCE